MADFVSLLSFRALLQDVGVSPNSSHEEANDCMINGATMNPAYYVGLQSTQPTAWPMPEGGDPLPSAGTPPTQHGFSRFLLELSCCVAF